MWCECSLLHFFLNLTVRLMLMCISLCRYDDPEDMWSFFGNGFHVCERDGSDITWYLGRPEREVDDKEVRETMSGLKGVPLVLGKGK